MIWAEGRPLLTRAFLCLQKLNQDTASFCLFWRVELHRPFLVVAILAIKNPGSIKYDSHGDRDSARISSHNGWPRWGRPRVLTDKLRPLVLCLILRLHAPKQSLCCVSS